MAYFSPEEIWLVNNRALAAEHRANWLKAASRGLLLRPGLYNFNQFIQRLLEEFPSARPPLNAWARRFRLMSWVAENWPLRLENPAPALLSHLAGRLDKLWSAWTLSGLNPALLAGLSPADWGGRLAAGFREYQAWLGPGDYSGRVRALLNALAAGRRPALLKTVSLIKVGPVFNLSALEIDLLKALSRLVKISLQFRIPAWALAERPPLSGAGLNALLALKALEASAEDGDLELALEPLADQRSPKALQWVAENLLAFPEEGPGPAGPPLEGSLFFSEAFEVKDEVRAVARRLRVLLDQGFPPEELALAAPDIDLYEPLVLAAAAQYQLPVAARGRRLDIAGPIKAFRNWLELAASSWPRLPTVQLLTSPYFQFTGLPPEITYDLALKAGLTDQRAGPPFPDLLLKLSQPQAQELAAAGRRLLQYGRSLAQAEDWPAFLKSLADFLAWSGFKDRLGPEPLDLAAGVRLESLLAEAGQILGQPGAPPVDMEFFKFLFDELAGAQRFDFNLGPAGKIRLLTYEEAAEGRFGEVFLMGLGERIFPAPAESSPPWPESLEQGLTALLGRLRWPGPAENYRHQEELLGRVIGLTVRRVNLSYHRLGPDLKPVLPSPLWGGLRRLAASPPPVFRIPIENNPAPEEILSFEEMWAKILRDGAAWGPALRQRPPGAQAGFGRALLRRARLYKQRKRWLNALILNGNEASGPLIDPNALRGWLASLKVWRKRPVLNPSQLESYARCPFWFWLGEVLRLRPEQAPADDPRTAELGSLAHAVLKEFVAGQTKRGRWPLADDPPTRARLEQIIEERARKFAAAHPGGREPVWEVRREYLKKMLRHWLRREAASPSAKEFTPFLFEWSFGPRPQAEDSAPSLAGEKPVAAEPEPGQPVPIGDGPLGLALGGRVDRVDLSSSEALVWDYKLNFREDFSKRLRPSDHQPQYLQLAVYTLAVSRHFNRVTRAGYKHLAGPETEECFGPASDEPALSLEEPLRRAMAAEGRFNLPNLIGRLWKDLRAGYFPPQDGDHCSFCPAAHLCPIKEA